jgi:hypothetical protein
VKGAKRSAFILHIYPIIPQKAPDRKRRGLSKLGGNGDHVSSEEIYGRDRSRP